MQICRSHAEAWTLKQGSQACLLLDINMLECQCYHNCSCQLSQCLFSCINKNMLTVSKAPTFQSQSPQNALPPSRSQAEGSWSWQLAPSQSVRPGHTAWLLTPRLRAHQTTPACISLCSPPCLGSNCSLFRKQCLGTAFKSSYHG